MAQPGSRPQSTAAELLDVARHYQLLDAKHHDEAVRLAARAADAKALARDLLQRGWLTPYQVNQLLLGLGHELVIGPYVISERLGEGGTGQVFKARHQKMNRVVAVKLIRKDLVADAEVVGRFTREIQVISRLSHPNIVHAFDAGPHGATFFLAMEYVEGIDLARLVKQSGPLPCAAACAYIRQAALGLQHVHEHGLVHRDIKPPNLLVSGREAATTHHSPFTTHQIKILDLGLARLQHPVSGEATSLLTPTGAAMMMGTPDYMAPEQAIDFHAVDIRADIYSLGCTFYYLLTGQPPFPGGMLAEKLLRHQQAAPPAVERADLPPGLQDVLRRMLAKKPGDRFQTPGAMAAALERFTDSKLMSPAGPPRALRRRGLLAGVASLVVLAGAILWLVAGRSTAPAPTTAAAEQGKPVYLSDLPTAEVSVRDGTQFGKNGMWSYAGQPRSVIVDRLARSKALYTHPPFKGQARVGYRLGKQYRQFKTTVAENDDSSPMPNLEFAVWGDKRLLWSWKMGKAEKKECEVDVSGVDLLELTVGNTTESNQYSFAVWIDPYLMR